jgi:SAM-dependent methyltransferase
MEDTPDRGSPPRTDGRLIHWAFLYDLLLRVLFVGQERAFRNRIADLARLAPGESVLDVGCGTGTLAIVAKQRVGAEGTVSGIDASPAMISRARQKALTASANVDFRVAAVEALPWPVPRRGARWGSDHRILQHRCDTARPAVVSHLPEAHGHRDGSWTRSSRAGRALRTSPELLLLPLRHPQGQ